MALARTTDTDTPLEVALHAIGGYVGGAIGAAVPDVLEPAVHSYHRDVVHSFVAGGAVVISTPLVLERWENYCRTNAQAAAAQRQRQDLTPLNQLASVAAELMWTIAYGVGAGFVAGYGSHLLLDSMTPRGIPLLTRGF